MIKCIYRVRCSRTFCLQTMTSQALASLTATYTDSEGEENYDDEEPQSASPSDNSVKSLSVVEEPKESKPQVVKTKKQKKRRLVSYHDDTIASDDEEEESEDEEEVEEEEPVKVEEVEEIDDDSAIDKKYEHLGVKLPSEPVGKCRQDIQEKINKLYDKMIRGNLDMNKVIQERKDFRNPSIYEKLIQFCGINELGTNYPPEIYDPFRFGKESYYEELARVQKVEMDRREKERKEKTKVDFISSTSAKKLADEEESKKRKSKWDQPAPNSSIITNVKPAGLVQPSLTKNVTGTKDVKN